MISQGALEIRCSQDTLFRIMIDLVEWYGGDSDCMVICDVPRRLAARYNDSVLRPNYWKRDKKNSVSFSHEKATISFIEDDEYSDDVTYTWVIKYLGDLPKCQKK